ncbi:baculoviral IAP repeat-containing protein 5.2-like [Nerophis ophidion]|uniref:baculoviral IAP repeat-containing protein 5.2-like n=1 Tax=Nerophis ophidion TaxID=159077 RepID=UPI002ADFA3A3|nr:baculoviral IAP repeat-containing protein 5.2-like [Nerophis ophidion]
MELFNESDTFKMYFCENRLKTFEGWPFDEDCACTPENMAKAGFIYTPVDNSPDAATCFFCLKELEGWEPDDDPQKEHKSHSLSCHFLALKKKVEELPLNEFLKLHQARHKRLISKNCNEAVDKFEVAARLVKSEILKMEMGK